MTLQFESASNNDLIIRGEFVNKVGDNAHHLAYAILSLNNLEMKLKNINCKFPKRFLCPTLVYHADCRMTLYSNDRASLNSK